MTMTLNQEQQICKLAVALSIVFCSLFAYSSLEQQCYAKNSEQSLVIDYSHFDAGKVKETADNFFQSAVDSQNGEEKSEYLKNAAAQYYILSNINKSDLYPYIQLARIYDMQKNDSYAKAYFYKALGINSRNSDANFYFGEFYYAREDYKKALIYYQKSLKLGKENDYVILKKIGKIYERFGDLQRANTYFQKSLEINPEDEELMSKTQELLEYKDEYERSGYYKRRLRY